MQFYSMIQMGTNEETQKIIDLLKQKVLMCRINRQAYQRWMNIITTIRFVMIAGAILLLCAAVGTMIRPLDYITATDTVVAISCAFGAVLLASSHIVLQMDKLHNESRRVLGQYMSLEVKCETAQALPYTAMHQAYRDVVEKQQLIKNEAKSQPPRWIKNQVRVIERKFA